MFDGSTPIFQQLAERITDDILRGRYKEGDQVPSTNELASYLRINPATAGKGLGLLVERGILVKRRGIGMFVAPGIRERLFAARRDHFVRNFVDPLLAEAQAIGLDGAAVKRLIADAVDDTDGALSATD